MKKSYRYKMAYFLYFVGLIVIAQLAAPVWIIMGRANETPYDSLKECTSNFIIGGLGLVLILWYRKQLVIDMDEKTISMVSTFSRQKLNFDNIKGYWLYVSYEGMYGGKDTTIGSIILESNYSPRKKMTIKSNFKNAGAFGEIKDWVKENFKDLAKEDWSMKNKETFSDLDKA